MSTQKMFNYRFINCKQGFINVGKYKNFEVRHVPVSYLKWVIKNVNLNADEYQLVLSYINLKCRKKTKQITILKLKKKKRPVIYYGHNTITK